MWNNPKAKKPNRLANIAITLAVFGLLGLLVFMAL